MPREGQLRRDLGGSTNCAVQCQGGVRSPQTRAASLFEAVANVVTGFLVALLGQQILLALTAIRAGLRTHSGIPNLFRLESLVRSCPLPRLFGKMAWRQHEERRTRRQRYQRRRPGGPC